MTTEEQIVPDAEKRRVVRHGMSKTREYRAWLAMKTRTLNPNFARLESYAGRGITLTPEWAGSFLAFFKHIGPRPSVKHSVDRIENDRGYEPGNVRWATRAQQAQNRRGTIITEAIFKEIDQLTLEGLSPMGIGQFLNISPERIRAAINRRQSQDNPKPKDLHVLRFPPGSSRKLREAELDRWLKENKAKVATRHPNAIAKLLRAEGFYSPTVGTGDIRVFLQRRCRKLGLPYSNL